MVEPIRLTGAQETLLATLQARAIDNRRPDPVLGDGMAEEVLGRLDYDFRRLRTGAKDERTVTFRAKKLDEWTRQFLIEHEATGATVLHLACGLDSRAFRLDLPAGVEWIDVDQPDVIELREQLYPKPPGYRTIATSVTRSEWLGKIPDDRPALVIAEGLTPYLQKADGEEMLRRLTHRLPTGRMIFDAVLPWTLGFAKYSQLLRATGASFHWGVGDPRELERLVPGLRFVEQWSLYDSPYLRTASPLERLVGAVAGRVPALRFAHRILDYRF
ncbi:class I SAM-dependent methyltransferase [Kitasatospora sp. NPDC059463]|uniref:class I SAM-dependent methyltransferase n=1 Tax=unclassified Kitasatospora TaxID=2633591 RepID=UPI003687233A